MIQSPENRSFSSISIGSKQVAESFATVMPQRSNPEGEGGLRTKARWDWLSTRKNSNAVPESSEETPLISQPPSEPEGEVLTTPEHNKNSWVENRIIKYIVNNLHHDI